MEGLIILILLIILTFGCSGSKGESHGNMITPRADLSKNPWDPQE